MCENDLTTKEDINLYLNIQLPLLIQGRNPKVFHDLAKQNANKMLQCSMIGIIWRNLSDLSVVGNHRIITKWWSAEPQTEEYRPKIDLVQIACGVLHWMSVENM